MKLSEIKLPSNRKFGLFFTFVFAVAAAFINSTNEPEWTQIVPSTDVELIFLIAFMGWMPAPLDV